jgi:hypothetical protein
MRPPVRLKPGMWIGFEEQRHQVTGFVDGMVRLRSEAGVAQLILVGELLGHASFRPQVDNPAEPDPGTAEPDPSALLDGLSKARRTELRRMQAHLLEMTTGFRSGEAASAVAGEPRAAYNPALTLQTRVEAKAAELGCSAAVMWKRLHRWREQGLAGLIDRRTVRLSNPLGGTRDVNERPVLRRRRTPSRPAGPDTSTAVSARRASPAARSRTPAASRRAPPATAPTAVGSSAAGS